MEVILEKLAASKKYRDLCPDTLRRVAGACAQRYRKPKEAEKAAKEILHGITGAFMDADSLRLARERLEAGDVTGALMLHASTRERMPLDKFYETLFEKTGVPARVLDIACGLNPVYLGNLGIAVTGLDIAGAQIELIEEWAIKTGAPVSCHVRDVLTEDALPMEHFDLALVMKLLPVLENQKKGAAACLLTGIDADRIAVTFPTRTLGGRGVGMEGHYSAWFEGILPAGFTVEQRMIINGELIYLLGKRG